MATSTLGVLAATSVDYNDLINVPLAGTATLGVAAFSNSNFTVSSGTVSLGTIYPRYTGVPTAGALAIWSGAGTVTFNAGYGTADLVLTSGAQSVAGVKTFTDGISFGNETLTIYNEGTWTPALLFGGASTGITYGTQTGTYTRIGNRVWVHCTIVLTSKGSATGSASISGLPYTVARTTNCLCRWRAMSASYVTMLVLPLVSTTTLVFRAATAAATAVDTDLTDASFGNTSTIVFEATYEV